MHNNPLKISHTKLYIQTLIQFPPEKKARLLGIGSGPGLRGKRLELLFSAIGFDFAQYFNFDWSNAAPGKAKTLGGTDGDINDTAFHKWATIIDR